MSFLKNDAQLKKKKERQSQKFIKKEIQAQYKRKRKKQLD